MDEDAKSCEVGESKKSRNQDHDLADDRQTFARHVASSPTTKKTADENSGGDGQTSNAKEK
jgi:hypothetical protein